MYSSENPTEGDPTRRRILSEDPTTKVPNKTALRTKAFDATDIFPEGGLCVGVWREGSYFPALLGGSPVSLVAASYVG